MGKQLRKLSRANLKLLVKDYDTAKWYEGMSGKVSLRFYIQEKKEVKYELCYRNSIDSTFYAKARMNALKLEEQMGRGKENYDRSCKVCGQEDEDIVHFIVRCEKLEEARNTDLLDRGIENPEEMMRKLLFREERGQEVGKMIRKLWESKKKQLKEKKEDTTDTCPQGAGVTTHSCNCSRKKKRKKAKKKIQSQNKTPENSPPTTQGCRQSER